MADVTKDIVDEVQRSLHRTCWNVGCGGAALTTFELALGEKVPRSIVVPNDALSYDIRHYEGEANLLVWCSWRLDGPDAPLTSWDDTVENVERVLEGLVGRTIEHVRVDLPGWDLHLDFTGGLRLHVFCDHVPGDPSFDGNWTLYLTNKLISIGVGSKCEVEPRTP